MCDCFSVIGHTWLWLLALRSCDGSHTTVAVSGTYLYMETNHLEQSDNKAVLLSPKFPAPPAEHSQQDSPFYNTCKVSVADSALIYTASCNCE